jgi:hypothetical protein
MPSHHRNTKKGDSKMKRLRTYAVFAGGLVILIGCLNLLTPSVAEAPPTTQVVVVNPGTSPVLVRDVDNRARQPFQEMKESNCTNTSACSVQFTDPPAGKLLVVETVSAQVVIVPTGAEFVLGFSVNQPSGNINLYLAPVRTVSDFSGHDIYQVTQQVRAYNQGSGPACGMSAPNGATNLRIICAFAGYLVDAS